MQPVAREPREAGAAGAAGAPWPPGVPYAARVDRTTRALVDAVVAYGLLEMARAITQWAAGTRPRDAHCALAAHVPFALAEELAGTDDLFTPVLRAAFPGFTWDEGDYGVTEDGGRYYFLAPSGGLARWAPIAERLLAPGVLVLPHDGRTEAADERYELRVERALAPAGGGGGQPGPPPAALAALQARHAAEPAAFGPHLVLRTAYAAVCNVRYPAAAATDPRAVDCAVPLAGGEALARSARLLAVQLALALERGILLVVETEQHGRSD